MKRFLPILALVLTVPLFGQGVRIDLPVRVSGPNVPVSGGPLPQSLILANARVSICTHPTPAIGACTPVATSTDATHDHAMPYQYTHRAVARKCLRKHNRNHWKLGVLVCWQVWTTLSMGHTGYRDHIYLGRNSRSSQHVPGPPGPQGARPT